MQHPASLSDEELLSDCELAFVKRGGPGGQHRNKTSTAVVIKHRKTNLQAEASENRSQAENRRQAIRRLKLILAIEHRRPITEVIVPSQTWQNRVVQNKISIAESHVDFPGLMAECLDFLFKHDHQMALAAASLGISSSQIVKLLKLHPPAFELANQQRQLRGLHRLS